MTSGILRGLPYAEIAIEKKIKPLTVRTQVKVMAYRRRRTTSTSCIAKLS